MPTGTDTPPKAGLGGRLESDQGSATVEFLGLALILLIPLIYLMVFVSQVQAAAYAAVAASDQAASAVVISEGAVAEAAAQHAALLTLGDYGAREFPHSVSVQCTHSCAALEPGDVVRVAVEVSVPMPLVPVIGASFAPVTVSADAQQRVPQY
ncbi:MAG: hypothetical protein Q4G34_03405 [Micrococcus sp.]|nr:hypothetical protein [Micrococcus sp.]